MEAHRRDAGLVRTVGPWGLAANIIGMVVGASIFVVPASLAANMGPYAPWAILVCGIALGAVSICFAEGGSRMPSSGGAYGYIEAAFGPLAGYASGTLLWFSNVLACGGIAAALADVVVTVVPQAFRPMVHGLVIVAAIGGIAAINLGGVARGTRLVGAATVLKLVPLAVFLGVGAFAVRGANLAGTALPSGAGVGRAMILALFAYMGMETSLCASGEVRTPERTIPRAVALAMGGVVLLYVAIQVITQGILGPALATSTVPLADAMGRIHPVLRLLMLAGAAVSMFGYLGSDILGTPRILFAFGRDGMLPRALGRLHSQSRAPHVAILCYAAVALVLALSGTFAELAVLSAIAMAPFYIAGCAAAYKLARAGVAHAGPPLGFRWLGTAAIVGILAMLALVAFASRDEMLGLGALLGTIVAVYLVQTRWGRRAAA